MGTVSYASTPYATDVRQKLDSVVWSSVSKLEEEPSAICSAETTSERVSSPKVSVDFSTLAKINSSFDRVKIKDIFAMSNRLSDVLTYQEIEEVLNHGEAYESYLSDEIFEALQLIKMEMDEEFTNNSLTDLENLRQSKKKRISLNKGALDQSIADHFESELHISAVFEGNRSLRRTAKTPKPLPNFQEFEHGNWKRTLVEVSRGSTEAFFEESLGDSPFKNRRKKIIAPVSLSLLDISDSPERNLMKELTTNVSEMIISNQQNCENTKESEKPKIITDDDDDDAIISRSSECHCSESSSPGLKFSTLSSVINNTNLK